ncbi:MAG: class I SAM-dependent methyltransferase [Candidatus Nezhaarchaeales archaeon]
MGASEKRARALIKDIIETYESIAEGFSATRKSPWIEMLKPLGDVLGKSVLDVGCGNGRHLVVLAKRASIAVGIDLSRNLIKIAKTRVNKLGLSDRAMLVIADILFMPFRRASFDNIICIAVIHHIPTEKLRLKAMSEMAETLKSNGLMVVSAWYRWQRRLLLKVLRGAIMRLMNKAFEFGDAYVSWSFRGRKYERFYHLFTLKEMEELLNRSQLKIQDLKLVAIGSKRWINVMATAVKR